MGETETRIRTEVGALRNTVHPEAALAAVSLLQRMTDNVVQYPSDDKYRAVKLSSKAVSNNLWKYPEAQRLARASGWVPRGEELVLALAPPGGAAGVCPAAVLSVRSVLEGISLDLQAVCRRREEARVAAAHEAHLREEEARRGRFERQLALDRAMDEADTIGDIEAISLLPGGVLETLSTLLRNPYLQPETERMRRLRVENPRVAEILGHDVGVRVLRDAGFVESEGKELELKDLTAIPGCLCALSAAVAIQQQREEDTFAEHAAAVARRGEAQKKRAQEEERDKMHKVLSPAQQERLLTATGLVSDVQGFMEQDWLLRGGQGFEAR
eukprot:Hpha_TRINITY_DN16032_c1_g1::TRINITY_DN16032_c1_g1_i1::g.121937::m.121937